MAKKISYLAEPQPAPSRLVEVAHLARVSPATVSRAFNAPHLLRASTLERVNAAAARLRYVPDGLARSLRRNRSMVIGAVVPSFRHAYFAAMVEGLQRAAAKQGYAVLLGTSDFDEGKELASVEAMVRQGVDGIILVGRQHDIGLLAFLRDQSKPFILTWSYDPDLPSVGVDHRRAMQPAVAHLLDLGHRDMVAILAFLAVSDRERARLDGIADAFAARGLAFAPERVIASEGSSLQQGRDAFRRARRRFPRATAAICANDLLAAGVLAECRAQGLDVPGEISVLGYGGLDVGAASWPAIATVQIPSEEMGRQAAECLLARLAGAPIPDRIELATEFLPRASTGAVVNRRIRKKADV